MRISMPTAVVEGTQLTVMPFRVDAVIGTMSVPTLVQLVPSPRREEDTKTLKAASGAVRRLLARLIAEHSAHVVSRSALTAPAVLAGLGIGVHHTMPWAEPANALSTDALQRLLADIQWAREARCWDGVAAKAGATGRLNFSGGVKDSGGRVADAMPYPGTEAGRHIRGQ